MDSILILVVVIKQCFKLFYRTRKVGRWCSVFDRVVVVGTKQCPGRQIDVTSLCRNRQNFNGRMVTVASVKGGIGGREWRDPWFGVFKSWLANGVVLGVGN